MWRKCVWYYIDTFSESSVQHYCQCDYVKNGGDEKSMSLKTA